MKTVRLLLLLVVMPMVLHAQKGITFKVEKLEPPKFLLPITSSDSIFQGLILSDASNYSLRDYKKNKQQDFQHGIVAQSNPSERLVDMGYHAFFMGMYWAYAQHHPFVLSPDMMWLLITQGFAQHVNHNAEELRSLFVTHNGRASLIVCNNKIKLDNPNSPWEEVFPEFTKQIGGYAGDDLINVLTSNFSTTTPTTKVASEITIMDALKPYFEYIVMRIVCGIPEITLEGTPEDWQKLLEKARFLKKYKLEWWIDEIEPLLKEFVKASKGDIDKNFWRNMFKYHSQKKYGAPNIINGWIVKFFPYDKHGKRYNLKKIIQRDQLPNEMVKVDLTYIEVNDVTGETVKTPLEMWAGFIGLQQNVETFALKPQIAWMIKKKDVDNTLLRDELQSAALSDEGVRIYVDKVPKELLALKYIKTLRINFTDKIIIPEEMSKIRIDKFAMSGKISEEEINRICKLFPNTILRINEKFYNQILGSGEPSYW